MEKHEIAIEHNRVCINFFYTDELVSAEQLNEYKTWIEYAACAIDTGFYKEEKKAIINLSIVDDEEIKSINNEYRQKDKVTDVLSFPMQDDMRNGEFESFMPEIELGDILVCKSVCETQADEFKISYFEEFVHLFIHGFLHVYGYDHEISEDEEKIMFDLEKILVEKISEIKKAS